MSKLRGGAAVNKDETRRMEDETRRMEMKLEMLRKTLDTGTDVASKGQGGARWKAGDAKKPITRGYVNQVLQPQARAEGKRSAAVRRPSGGLTSQQQMPEVRSEGALAAVLSASPQQDQADAAPVTTGRAAVNLQAAMSQQSDEASEVEAFLAGIGLDRYNALFLEHGFDCMEVVLEMQESHMQDIGMSTGHIIKLRKRLAEMAPAKQVDPQPAPPPAGILASSGRKNVTWGRTEATSVPAAKSDGVGCGGGSLLDGDYNEAEAAASFQEAVMAWRRQGAAKDGADGVARDGDNAARASSQPGSFWSTVGGPDMDLIRASTPTQPPAEALAGTADTQIQHDPAPSEEKLCCYQCYKQFYAKYAVERDNPLPGSEGEKRRLCSEACADAWVAANEAKAAELRKRREKLEILEERARIVAEEQKLSEAGAEPVEVPAPVPVAA